MVTILNSFTVFIWGACAGVLLCIVIQGIWNWDRVLAWQERRREKKREALLKQKLVRRVLGLAAANSWGGMVVWQHDPDGSNRAVVLQPSPGPHAWREWCKHAVIAELIAMENALTKYLGQMARARYEQKPHQD